MKEKNSSRLKKTILVGAIAIGVISNAGLTFAQSYTEQPQVVSQVNRNQETKFPQDVMKVVRKSLGVKANSTELDDQINTMPKIKVMDIVLDSKHNKAKGKFIRKTVNDTFKTDLERMSQNNEGNLLSAYPLDIMQGVRSDLKLEPNDTKLDAEIMRMPKSEVMDRFLDSYGDTISGAESRRIINEIFGVNLVGIDSLEKAKLALYSKGQWIVKSDADIFLLLVGKGDIDASVGVTNLYVELTGSDQLPVEIQEFLTGLGFTYNSDDNMYHCTSPTGESFPDAFKGRLIGTLVGYIAQHYAS